MKTILIPTLLLLAVLPLALTRGQPPGPKAPPPAEHPELTPSLQAYLKAVEVAPGDTRLQKLLKDRHNTAVRLLEERVKEYKSGIRDASPIFEAARLVIEGKLDLAADAKARVDVLKKSMELATLIEKRLQEQLDKGFGSQGDLERARYARLSIEAEIEKAEQK